MKVLLYLRVSTDEQAFGFSLMVNFGKSLMLRKVEYSNDALYGKSTLVRTLSTDILVLSNLFKKVA